MGVNRIEPLERELFAKPVWFSREHIRFVFNHRNYANGSFGSRTGPTDSLIEAGLHELAHAIDFDLTGRPARLQYERIDFRRPYANAIYLHGKMYDDFPQTTRGSWCEIRTNAIQTLLAVKAFGTAFKYTYKDDQDFLVPCTVEEALQRDARGLWVLDDASNFHRERGKDKPVSECYYEAMHEYYEKLDTPFATGRIQKALDRVNKRLGRLHAKHEPVGYIPKSDARHRATPVRAWMGHVGNASTG